MHLETASGPNFYKSHHLLSNNECQLMQPSNRLLALPQLACGSPPIGLRLSIDRSTFFPRRSNYAAGSIAADNSYILDHDNSD